MVELPQQSILDSIAYVISTCRDLGQADAEQGLINLASSLVTYSPTEIEVRVKQIASLVSLHGWCQIHLMPEAKLQLSFKLQAGVLAVKLIPSDEMKDVLSESIDRLKPRIEEILNQEVRIAA